MQRMSSLFIDNSLAT